MLDACQRDRARNDLVLGDKGVGAVRWLECDAQAPFCHDGVKVASNWVPFLTAGARLCTFSAPEDDLPNSVSQEVSLLVAGVGTAVVAARRYWREMREALDPSRYHRYSAPMPAAKRLVPRQTTVSVCPSQVTVLVVRGIVAMRRGPAWTNPGLKRVLSVEQVLAVLCGLA